MMFPAVLDAGTTSIVRKVTQTGGNTFDPTSLWSQNEVNSFAQDVARRISWFFAIFGHYASIAIGLYVSWKLGVYRALTSIASCSTNTEHPSGQCVQV